MWHQIDWGTKNKESYEIKNDFKKKYKKKLKVKIKLKIIKTKNGWVDKFLYGNMVIKYESEQHVWNVNKLNQRIYHPRQFVKHKFVWSYNVVPGKISE